MPLGESQRAVKVKQYQIRIPESRGGWEIRKHKEPANVKWEEKKRVTEWRTYEIVTFPSLYSYPRLCQVCWSLIYLNNHHMIMWGVWIGRGETSRLYQKQTAKKNILIRLKMSAYGCVYATPSGSILEYETEAMSNNLTLCIVFILQRIKFYELKAYEIHCSSSTQLCKRLWLVNCVVCMVP